MTIKTDIKKILCESMNAPSGSNSQPWRFEIGDDFVNIIALPEKDHPILNYNNRGTWIAHGALLENIVTVANAYNLKTKVELLPEEQSTTTTATVRFLESADEINHQLIETVKRRATNRKIYKKEPMPQAILSSLVAVPNFNDVGIYFADQDEKISVLAKAGSVNEIVTLENRVLHKLFFDEIVWNPQTEQQQKSGLFIETMELAPPQKKALKIFKSWRIMSFLNKLGIARGIAKSNAKVYASASLYVAITTINNSRESFIHAGMIMERIWLKAVAHDLSAHIISGTLFFWQSLNGGNLAGFSEKHSKLINDAYKEAKETLNIKDGETLTLFLRIGSAEAPTATSTKKSPNIVIL